MKEIDKWRTSKEFTVKEKMLIESVLDLYDFQINNISKVRSAYKVETSQGNVCLKRMKHGRNKVENGNMLVDGLIQNDFKNVPKYYRTKSKNYFVKKRKYIFYATEWIDGAECDMSNLEETVECVKFLAQFHNAVSKIDVSKLKIYNNIKNWPVIFNKNLNDLERFEKIIKSKIIKNEFDISYLDYIEPMCNMGLISIDLLNKSEYYRMSRQVNQCKTICHDSFYYQNIIKKDKEYYIIDLDSIVVDHQVNDLGKLIRRLMYKKEYQWDFSKAKVMIEAYNSVKKLSKNELEIMLALIIFPHKFWKIGKKRYLKHKEWSEVKYMHRLQKLMKYNNEQQKFIVDYLDYLNLYD